MNTIAICSINEQDLRAFNELTEATASLKTEALKSFNMNLNKFFQHYVRDYIKSLPKESQPNFYYKIFSVKNKEKIKNLSHQQVAELVKIVLKYKNQMMQLSKQFDDKKAQIKTQWEKRLEKVMLNSDKLRRRMIAVKYQLIKLLTIEAFKENIPSTKVAIDECIHEYGDELNDFGVGLFKTTDFHKNVTADIDAKLMELNKCHVDLQKDFQAFF